MTIPEDVLDAARGRVEAGDADSLSAYITGALRRRLDQDVRLAETVNWVYETFGKPTEEDIARSWRISDPCCHDQGAFSNLIGLGWCGVSSVE
ncbi:MAG: hypothetical protein ACJ73S_13530 [Mycobacteriales bacterium]